MKHRAAPLGGCDGRGKDIPLLGYVQVVPARFYKRIKKVANGTHILTVTISTLAIGLATSLFFLGEGIEGPLWATAALACFALAAEQQPVRLSSRTEVTVSVFPVVFGAVAFGPLTAMLIGAAGLLGDFRRPYLRWATWTSGRSLAAGLAGTAAAPFAYDHVWTLRDICAAVVVALVVDAVVDLGLAATIMRVRGAGCYRSFIRASAPMLMMTVPIYAPLLVVLVYAYGELSAWSMLLFLAPTLAAHRLYHLYRGQQNATEELRRANELLEHANVSFAGALVAALDARDQYTAGHSAAVADYARDIARELNMSHEEQELIHLCGLVHDIGKVGLPAGILEKAGPLTPSERLTMEQHSAIGERILAKVEGYAEIARVVRHHHERVDGGGYPDRLKGNEIPTMARILAVADAFDAMTSARPYRDAMPASLALERLKNDAGAQFDEAVVAAFVSLLRTRVELTADTASVELLPMARPPALAYTA
jgi:putative nucleotidyltransferase with HDIG domain